MKSDLRKCKVGDTIWTIQEGCTEVIEVIEKSNYPIETINSSYTKDGKSDIEDQFPSAFLECPFVEVKEYYVSDERFTNIVRGIVIDNKLFIESDWTEWKEIEQKVTLEIPLSELENNPELKKYLKQ